MARSAIISFYDWAQYPGVTLTGGSFETEFPAEFMLTLQPQIVAKVVGTSVTFTINLTTSRAIGLIHLQNLVTDTTGTIQVVAGSYDSGVVNSWATDGAGTYPQLLYTALGRPRVFIPTAPVTASAVTITINSVTDIMIGFVGVCEIYQTPFDILAGPIVTIMDDADIQKIPFGSRYVVPRSIERRIDMALPPMPDANFSSNDSYIRSFDLAMINGKTNPVIVTKFPDDTGNIERNSVWGLISNDATFANRFFGYHDVTFQVTQLV